MAAQLASVTRKACLRDLKMPGTSVLGIFLVESVRVPTLGKLCAAAQLFPSDAHQS